METDGAVVALRTTRRRAQVDEWALVLTAEGLHPQVLGGATGFVLSLPADEVGRAETALAAWQRENQPPPPPPERPALDRRPAAHALLVASALLASFAATGPAGSASSALGAAGAADAAAIRAGAWWRTITALTLHADVPHVVGNALAGALFLAAVFRALGPGVGAALVLAAGALGNLADAVGRRGDHATIGASTAVFGALGLLVGATVVTRRGARAGRALVLPIAAGLGLLAMLGTEGEHVDIWAHALGLAAGVPLGAGAARLPTRWLARRPLQWAAGTAAAAAIALAWWLALR
jgi:rhomboid protease GluP